MRRAGRLLAAALAATALAASPPAPASRTFAGTLDVRRFAFCPGGQRITAGGHGAWVIDWPSGDVRDAPLPDMPSCPALTAGFSPDGKWWATPGTGEVELRSGTTGEILKHLAGHLGSVTATLFSPDGRFLASSGTDNDVRIWDAHTFAPLKTIDSMSYTPFAMAWAPDSRVLYVGGSSRNVMAWSADTWTLLRSSAATRFAVGALAVSADGRTVAAAGWDPDASARPAAVQVLAADTLAERLSISTPAPANPVAFSPDGKSLVGLIRGQAGLTIWPME
jgi:WD40 repeat protein